MVARFKFRGWGIFCSIYLGFEPINNYLFDKIGLSIYFYIYVFRYGDDDSSDVVQLDPSTSNSPTPGTSGIQKPMATIMSHRRWVT